MNFERISETWVGSLAERLPSHSLWVKVLKSGVKSVILRRRLVFTRNVVFEGIADAILQRACFPGPGRDEILIKTIFSAVSPGTERGYYLDEPDFHQPRPYVPGYSGCGRVIVAGGDSSGIRKADIVAGIMKHSGKCVRATESIVPVPPGVESREAAFVSLGVIARAGVRAASLVGGERVGIMGQGIIGQLADQMSRIEGASRVIALALGDSKKKIAEQSGVDEFIALGRRGRPRDVLGLDVVIDSTGSLKGFESALELVRPGGRVVMLGSIAAYAEKSDWARMAYEKGLEVRGAHVRNLQAEGLSYRGEALRFLNLLAEKKLKLDHLITDVYQARKAPEIYDRLTRSDRGMVGVLIDWRKYAQR